jgi:hypothetical protein
LRWSDGSGTKTRRRKQKFGGGEPEMLGLEILNMQDGRREKKVPCMNLVLASFATAVIPCLNEPDSKRETFCHLLPRPGASRFTATSERIKFLL